MGAWRGPSPAGADPASSPQPTPPPHPSTAATTHTLPLSSFLELKSTPHTTRLSKVHNSTALGAPPVFCRQAPLSSFVTFSAPGKESPPPPPSRHQARPGPTLGGPWSTLHLQGLSCLPRPRHRGGGTRPSAFYWACFPHLASCLQRSPILIRCRGQVPFPSLVIFHFRDKPHEFIRPQAAGSWGCWESRCCGHPLGHPVPCRSLSV